jgi:hypothetical protein
MRKVSLLFIERLKIPELTLTIKGIGRLKSLFHYMTLRFDASMDHHVNDSSFGRVEVKIFNPFLCYSLQNSFSGTRELGAFSAFG